jgi:hypothetical protein
MGYDTFQVQDLIEEKGIWTNHVDLILKAKQGQYVNVLKKPEPLPNYGFQPPNYN